jgi:predicted nucleic acid-binding protein
VKIADALRGVSQLAFDTAPLVYFMENNPTYIVRMRSIMKQVASGHPTGKASFLVLAEVLVQPIRTSNKTLVQQYENVLVNSSDFQLVPIGEAVSRKAAELRATYNLKTPDALHVASAIVSGCDAFLTNDTGIKRVTEIMVLILDELEV